MIVLVETFEFQVESFEFRVWCLRVLILWGLLISCWLLIILQQNLV